MASPNIVGLGTIIGLTTVTNLGNSSETVFLDHVNNSTNSLYKVNNIIVSNTTTTSVNCTIALRSSSGGGGTQYKITNSVPIAAYSTLVVIDKAASIYLEENKSLTATSSNGSGLLTVVASYEVIR